MKKQNLGWLLAGLLLCVAAVVPIQSNFFTSPNYTGTTAATARTYLGLGSMSIATTNEFMRTNQSGVFNISNNIAQFSASNIWATNLAVTNINAKHIGMTNQTIYTGAGTVSGANGGHILTLSGGTFHPNLYGALILIDGTAQFLVNEVTDSTHLRVMSPFNQAYSGVTWRYYSNHIDASEGSASEIPSFVVNAGGSVAVRSFEVANDAGYLLGSGTMSRYTRNITDYGGFGPAVLEQTEGAIAHFWALNAPNNTLATLGNGTVVLRGITNLDGTAIHLDNEVIFTNRTRWGGPSAPLNVSGSGSPEGAVTAPVGSHYMRTDGGAATSFYVKTNGSGNTGWGAVTPGGVTSLGPASFSAQYPPIDLAAGTNVDCSLAYVFYRATTNTAIAFATSNEQDGVAYEIHLFNTDATATPNVTITSATKIFHVSGVTAAAAITYGSPVANRELLIRFTNRGGTNYMTFEDNL